MVNSSEIILASGSAGRKAMLQNAGVRFTAIPADIDEQSIIDQGLQSNKTIKDITEELALEKARHIARQHPNALVIGSDQTLEFNNTILSKAKNTQDAADKLRALRGHTHHLHSAVCIVKADEALFSTIETASLTMHNFDDEFLRAYMDKDQDALTSCVGWYKIEGAGSWLFSNIQGDNFTIMGMPLLLLLGFLRQKHCFAP